MNKNSLRDLLSALESGKVDVSDVMEKLRHLPFEDLGFAKIDHHRDLRCGRQEVILCEGKSPEQIADISEKILENGHLVLGTRASEEDYDAVLKRWPDAEYHSTAGCIVIEQEPVEHQGRVVIVTGGTSDLPVASEARVTADVLGANVELISDVGVAGIHRLLGHVEELQKANVLIVVAGMEGALPSVVGGLVARPVIAVPTSVGYGASLGGVAPLLTMLNSCASGVSVMNIDNGFGAGYMAAMINEMASSND